jgi:hypothetical protein
VERWAPSSKGFGAISRRRPAAAESSGTPVIISYLIAKLNPTGIIPKGTPVDLRRHDRTRLAA